MINSARQGGSTIESEVTGERSQSGEKLKTNWVRGLRIIWW